MGVAGYNVTAVTLITVVTAVTVDVVVTYRYLPLLTVILVACDTGEYAARLVLSVFVPLTFLLKVAPISTVTCRYIPLYTVTCRYIP